MDMQEVFTARLVNALYVDAMILADEARSYFERENDPEITALTPSQRVDMSCESLRVTTRLMHSIAWLLNQKAYFAGEISLQQLRGNGRALGKSQPGNSDIIETLPIEARALVSASEQLYNRIARLEETMDVERNGMIAVTHAREPVVHQMQDRLLAELAL